MTSKRVLLILVMTLLAVIAGCSGENLYDLLTNFSRQQSRLIQKNQPIGGHLHMAYFDNNLPDKPTMVLLHGFGAQKEVWLPLAKRLHADYRLIIPDLVGDGESSRPMELDYTIGAQARRLHRFLTRLHIRRPIVVGNSMGGAIALMYASRYPTEKLVLIDPLGFESRKSYLQKQGIAEAEKVFLGICSRKDMEHFLGMVYDHPPYIPGILLDYMARRKCAVSRLDTRKARSLYRTDGGWVFARMLPKAARRVHTPVLILWGTEDKILNPANATAFRRHLPGAQVVYIPHAGHVPMMEKPDQTAAAIQTFLRR